MFILCYVFLLLVIGYFVIMCCLVFSFIIYIVHLFYIMFNIFMYLYIYIYICFFFYL